MARDRRGDSLARAIKVGRAFRASLDRAGIVAGTVLGRAVGATMRAIADAAALPGPHDQRVSIPPTGYGYVRRVGSLNLWLHFTFTDATAFFRVVVTMPPVPVHE